MYFQTGDVCISILHPPVDDPQSGELPSERWNPTQNVRYGQEWGERVGTHRRLLASIGLQAAADLPWFLLARVSWLPGPFF